MTDKEIFEALKICFLKDSCSECPYKPKKEDEAACMMRLMKDACELIDRQQAEIERLTNYNRCIDAQCRDLLDKEEKAKAEAIKEFAERLKKRSLPVDFVWISYDAVAVKAIDNLVKEMVGEDNA